MAVGVIAVCWCLATLVFVLAWCAAKGLTFNGPYAGLFAGDQLRYLAWIREAGLHGLIADPYRAGAAHVYLNPVFLVSGLLWRAGLSIQLSYLIWTPVALAVLIWGYARFVARFAAGRERAAALALSLFYFSPLVPLMDYGSIVDANGSNYLVIAAGHGAPYWQAWGFLPTTIALGLMPVCVLGWEALVDGVGTRRQVATTTVSGLIVAWLHPWGGIELLLVLAGLLAIRRTPLRGHPLVLCGLAIAAPLIYYAILAGANAAWSLSLLRTGTTDPNWPLLATYAPIAAVGALAIRRPRTAAGQSLGLWLIAVAITYLVLPNSRDAALEGVSLPLSILAVSGWRRLHLPSGFAWAALFLAIVPGAAYSADTFRDLFRSHDVAFALSGGEQRAAQSLSGTHGQVLATPYLAGALPAVTGIPGWQVATDTQLSGDARYGDVAQMVADAHAQTVILDCLSHYDDVDSALARLGFGAQRFGCARVYRRSSAAM